MVKFACQTLKGVVSHVWTLYSLINLTKGCIIIVDLHEVMSKQCFMMLYLNLLAVVTTV